MEDFEKKGLAYLPPAYRIAVTGMGLSRIDEIRLRLGRLLSLTADGCNHACGIRCGKGELEDTVERLCQGSLYSYADGIREGVIVTDCGIRAGISGQAVTVNGRVEAVRDISSVCIRLPHRIPGAADVVLRYMGEGGVLIFSPPGCGKTTVLREMIPELAKKRRVAVIDTRYELCVDQAGDLVDVFAGYPREFGIRSAVRTMSPEIIVCDEIAGEEDIRAILEAHLSGVTVCASVHGRSWKQAAERTGIKALLENGVFSLIYGRKNRTDPWERYSPVEWEGTVEKCLKIGSSD